MPRVVIVGAGPAGAALAYLLARREVEIVLLERATDFAREFRGEALLPSGLDAFAQMGLLPELKAVPHVEIGRFEFYVQGRPAGAFDFDPDAFPHKPHWISQPALLEMLVAQAGAHPGFRLERGVAARGLVVENDRIVGVRAKFADGEREVRGDLVIGADGRTSVVRRRAGLPEEADPTPMDVVWCKLPLPQFMSGTPTARAYVGGGHLLIAAPVYDGALQMAWVIRKGAYGEIRKQGMPECLDRMAAHVSPDLAGHLRAHRDDAVAPFLLSTVSDRVLEWCRPGMMVIGDAAHTMSPVGAQGLNIALRDALVAANHLVPVLEAGGEPDAIDTACLRIEDERKPEVQRIQRAQARPPRVILRDNLLVRAILWVVPRLLSGRATRFANAPLARDFLFGVGEVKLEV